MHLLYGHCRVVLHFATYIRMLYYKSLHCRWQTRATLCLTPTVRAVYRCWRSTHCDKLMTDDRHQFITSKLTAPETIDVQLRNFLSPEFGW